MHYVKHFSINGVDTKQVACIELQGRPNAATEGAVGVLGMDMLSPTHEVYRCVAVNGSVYTWELLSAGMSILSATVTREGGMTVAFPYDALLLPANYLIKLGDLIIDSEGYLYQIDAIGNESCSACYCGTRIGSVGGASENRLRVRNGKLEQVTENGTVLSSVDYLSVDKNTLYRMSGTGEARVNGIETIDGRTMRMFFGSRSEYNQLTDAQKENLIAFIDGMYVDALRVDWTYVKEMSEMVMYRHDIVIGVEETSITRAYFSVINTDPTDYSASWEYDYDSFEVITPLTAEHFAFLPNTPISATGFHDGSGSGNANGIIYSVHNGEDGVYFGTIEPSDGWWRDDFVMSHDALGYIRDTVTPIGADIYSGDGVSY